MRSLITYFIKYPITGNVIMVLTFIFGLVALYNLKSTFFPREREKEIKIQITYPGASPEEIEEGVVIKIEDNLKGVSGIERVSSVSRENSGTVTIEVLKGYDIDLILQDVKNEVDRISSFPLDMEPPVTYKIENINFAIKFAVTGTQDLKTLKKFARKIEDDLRAVKGISKVELSGFPEEEIEIAFRENDLRAYDLSFAEAANQVGKANLEITGGTVKSPQEEMLIRARYKRYYADEIRNIVVKTTPDGGIIRLKDVADVKDAWADDPSRSYLDEEIATVINLSSTIEEDILYITDYIRNYVVEFNAENAPIKAEVIQDQSKVLQERIDLLVENGIIGAILVLVLLTLFLNPYLAFWVAIGIPISFLGMFIIGLQADLTINVISLFGMIIVIGILVDDGIVISENIYQHYEMGKSANQAAIDGTMEVVPAVFTAVMTTVFAFSSFFFFDGRTGDFFSSMGFVVVATLLFSLIEGFLILPAHVAHSPALKGSFKSKKPNIFARVINPFLEGMRDKLYAPVLRFCLENKALTMSVFVVILLFSFSAISGGFVKTTFFPNVEQNSISISFKLPAGTREQYSLGLLDRIEEGVKQVNEDLKESHGGIDVITAINTQLGPATHEGSVSLILEDAEKRKLKGFQISNLISEKIGDISEAEELLYGTLSPFGKAISISLQSYDLEELRAASNELKRELEETKELKSITDSDQEGLREINIQLKDKAYQLGLQTQDILSQVRSGFFGFEVQRLQRGLDEVKVWVRYGQKDRASVEQLSQMRIRLSNGESFPLEELADFQIERGVIAINHLDTRREIRVEADLLNPESSLTDITSDVENNRLPKILEKYPGVSYSFEGQSRESAKTGASGAVVMPIVLISMFTLVVLTFRSFWQPVVIFLLLIFGFVGVTAGHYIHGAPISILSGLGIVALIGVMINDSLVLVGAMNTYLKEGKTFDEAVYRAGISRFRPIFLTTATTIAGLAPLILEKSFQAQFLVPMAISLAYGIAAATVVTLIALPVMLTVLNRAKILAVWLWEGKKPEPESVEPAVQELVAEHQ